MPARSTPVLTPATTKVPHLTATKFVSFGDSITEGFVQRCPGAEAGLANRISARFSLLLAQGRAQASPSAYPTKLQAMLTERYPAQSVTVVNEGLGGEEIQAGVANLPRVLTADAPEVLLLQEGINTLNANHAAGIPTVVEGLRTMIQEARSRGIVVLAATLLPERPGGCRAYSYAEGHDDIIAANVEIRSMVGTEGAVLVDLFEAFNGRTGLLIGQDGLHPSAAGYQKMAQAFFATIRRHLED
jgi:acyl-CoA thioesterase I